MKISHNPNDFACIDKINLKNLRSYSTPSNDDVRCCERVGVRYHLDTG